MTTEKRPRVPAEIAERIDRVRGGKSFEGWVRDALDAAAGRYWIVPDPTRPKRFVLLGEEDEVVATNLTERSASDLAEDRALAEQAFSAVSVLAENLEAIGESNADELRSIADRLFAIRGELTTA